MSGICSRISGRPVRRRPTGFILLVLLVIALPGACTPRLAPPGPGPTTPRLEQDQFIAADGLALPLRSWLPTGANPPKAAILALHGFNFYSGVFDAPARYWAARGIAIYAYDQRGFGAAPNPGLWSGTEALLSDLGDLSRTLRARHPGVPFYLLGDSMGGAVVLAAMARPDAPEVDGVVLIAPAVWARSTMPLFYRASLWLAARLVPWMTLTGRNLKIRASDNTEFLRALGRDPLIIKETRVDAVHGLVDLMDRALAAAPRIKVPALLLYGAKDQVIPGDPTVELWQRLPTADPPGQRPALYDEGWHLLLHDLQADLVRDDILHWIADPAAPLPSGAEARAAARLAKEN